MEVLVGILKVYNAGDVRCTLTCASCYVVGAVLCASCYVRHVMLSYVVGHAVGLLIHQVVQHTCMSCRRAFNY